VKYISESNAVDGPGAIYYGLRASENGVVRKAGPVNLNQSFIYNLRDLVEIRPTGSNNVDLNWRLGATNVGRDIPLPETGTFIFSFRLYGGSDKAISGSSYNRASSFYLEAYKNNVLSNRQTFVIHETYMYDWPVATYSINIPVSGEKDDKIHFRFGMISPYGTLTNLTLRVGNNSQANRTSMVFWKL